MHAKIIKSKKALSDAFLELAEKKDPSEITVSELCREANINRGTFYKYYSVPSDLLDELLEQTINASPLMTLEDDDSLLDSLTTYCQFFYDNKNLTRAVYHMGSALMLRSSAKYLIERNIDNPIVDERSSFISGGIIEAIMYWLENDFKKSPAEMANVLRRFILCIK